MKISNTEDYTIIDCWWNATINDLFAIEINSLENFTLPDKNLSLKNDIRFMYCGLSYKNNNVVVSKFMEDLGIKYVTELTFNYPRTPLNHYNLVGLKILRYLTVSGTDLAPDLLQNLTNLEILRLVDIYDIPNNFFKYSRKLKTLEILNSNFRELRREQFHGLANLTHLKLKINNIQFAEDSFTFEGLTSLKTLNISHYTLNILPPESFRNLINLETIIVFLNNAYEFIFYDRSYKIYTSKFINLPNKLFTNLKSMKELRIQSSAHWELPENIFVNNFGMLQNLSISGYKRDTLPENIFRNIPNITELRITNNFLTSLPSKIFENLEKLEFLDLSNNKLENLNM